MHVKSGDNLLSSPTWRGGDNMETILIILVLLVFFGGGGYYWSRWGPFLGAQIRAGSVASIRIRARSTMENIHKALFCPLGEHVGLIMHLKPYNQRNGSLEYHDTRRDLYL